MKLSIIISLLFLQIGFAQTKLVETFDVSIEAITIPNAPGVHSFSWAKNNQNQWLILGGRVDGLHRRQPWAAFWEEDNNHNAYVVDVANNQVYSAPINVLPQSIYEQLQSTNQQFYQYNGVLYITGGYGFSTTANDHITYPYLTAIDVDNTINAIINNQDLNPYFRQYYDENLAVTGGQMGMIDDEFFLVCGQRFDGVYNPMGPGSGQGFEQDYLSEIKRFTIDDNGSTVSISNYSYTKDIDVLGRRDYNMAPQIFPNGDKGFTVFTGVFQQPDDIPFLDVVNITESSYEVPDNFNQFLSQYHSAKFPIYDANANTMHTLFFGGMSQFTLDSNNNLVEDINVPFVSTISRVTRTAANELFEYKLNIEMPTLVGSGAEFIPMSNATYFNENEILMLNNIPTESTLVGYIYGGINSSAPNIFFINDGTQSFASNTIFKVYLSKDIISVEDVLVSTDRIFNMRIAPNPIKNNLINLTFYNPSKAYITIDLLDFNGRLITNLFTNNLDKGEQQIQLNTSKINSQNVILRLQNGTYSQSKTILIE